MSRTSEIRVKVTPLQYQVIKTRAQLAGFKTITGYIRAKALRDGDDIDNMIKEIYEKIVENE